MEIKVTQNKKAKEMFSNRLNQLKGSMNLSELEKVTGISRQTLNKYLNCIALPNSDSLMILADTFNVSCDYLLGRDEGTEHNIDYIMKETGLNESSIQQLKEYVSDNNSYLELFALNKLISFPQFRKFLEYYIKYISSPNLDLVIDDIFYLFAFPSYKDAINREIFKSFDTKNNAPYDTMVYWMITKELTEITSTFKNDENTKKELKKYIDDIMKKYGYNSYLQFYLNTNNK